MANFTFGSDPEFMLIRDGIFRSAIGIVPGTKYKRHRIGDNYYYYDNVMAECTIEPAASKPEALANFERAFRSFAKLVKPNILVVRASQEYPREELAHKDALEIGCDREFCCYALRDIEPPEEDFQSGQLRSAGGHLHIGSGANLLAGRVASSCLTFLPRLRKAGHMVETYARASIFHRLEKILLFFQLAGTLRMQRRTSSGSTIYRSVNFCCFRTRT